MLSPQRLIRQVIRAPKSSPFVRSLAATRRYMTATPTLTRSRESLDISPRKIQRTMTSVAQNQEAKDYGNFELLTSFDLEYAPVKVSKWRSKRTGLSVVVGGHKAPITNGYFVVASEIFDDTGRPHTLEHLVFLGSKSYPFKGVLDNLANRAGGSGTNAWTANDHTAYTIATAGSEGFLNMLPVFVDHILYPTITTAGFVTEVHHITGKGENAGVVYSEMQGRENQSGDLMALEMQRMMYPKDSAYRSETGGLMKNLRVLTAEQIREYHGTYYVPHNLCLHIDGSVPLDKLFEILNDKIEPTIIERNSLKDSETFTPPAGWKRPFLETPSAAPISISESQTKVVEFMEQDESIGEVQISWLGYSPTDTLAGMAIGILGSYLTDSTASPLQKAFVDIPEPLATSIGIYTSDRATKAEMTLYISDVPAEELETIGDKVKDVLKSIVKNDGIDMERMGLVLRRDKRKMLNAMETGASDVLADCVINDFLYGDKTGKDLPGSFEDMKDYRTMESWDKAKWASILNEYFVSAPSLTVIGKPSAALAEKIEKDEKARLEAQRKELGEEGLKKNEKILEDAMKESNEPIPAEMLTGFPIPDIKNINWVPVETASNSASKKRTDGVVQKHVDQDGDELPIDLSFTHVDSNFVFVSALLDVSHLPADLMPYLSLYKKSFFDLGVKRADGVELSPEEVTNQLNNLSVTHSLSFGFFGDFSDLLTLYFKVEKANYADAVAWVRDLIAGSIFSKERLSIALAKQIQEFPQRKRDGHTISAQFARSLRFDKTKSPAEACSLLNMLTFAPETAEVLKENPEEVIGKLEQIRQHFLKPSSMRVIVGGNVLSLEKPKTTWREKFWQVEKPVTPLPLPSAPETLTELGKAPSKSCILVPMASIEGSYSVHFAKGIVGWSHPDLAALQLATTILNAQESYLWKNIRGAGLAYGANVQVDEESGFVSFDVYRSPNAVKAYEEGARIMRQLCDGSVALDQNIIDGARSSMAYDFARKVETIMAAAIAAHSNQELKGVAADHGQRMLAELPSITPERLVEVIKKYILPVFDPATSLAACSVNAGKADELEAGFTALGYEVTRKELVQSADDEESGSESGSDSGSESGSEASV